MAVKRGGLGKGLDSLIPDTGKTAENKRNRLFLSGKDFGSQNYIDYLCGKCTEQEMVRAGG